MSQETKPASERSVESKIKFYEDHLASLEKKKAELNYSFYLSEKAVVERLIQELKNSI